MKKEQTKETKKKTSKALEISGEKLQKMIDDFSAKLPEGSQCLIMVNIEKGIALKMSGKRETITKMILIAAEHLDSMQLRIAFTVRLDTNFNILIL